MARDLIDGRRLLTHCGAGIGRTGTLATVVLALHEPLDAADQAVRAVGSGPEDAKQEELIRRCSRAMLQEPRP